MRVAAVGVPELEGTDHPKGIMQKQGGTMARDTTPNDRQDRLAKHANTPPGRRAADRPAADRQAPIPTNQESTRRTPAGSAGAGRGGLGSRSAQDVRGVAHRVGLTAAPSAQGNAFSLMQQLSDDVDRLFHQFGFGRWPAGLSPALGSTLVSHPWADRPALRRREDRDVLWAPQVEAFREGDKLVVRADLPGVKREDVHVDLENDVLTISGERCDERERDRNGFYTSERSYGSFYRAIPVPEGLNADQCEASFKDGVLEVTLAMPKDENRKTRRIRIT
jgi:HSP20 family protein